MKKQVRLVLLMMAWLALWGCGLKGPLYIPAEPVPAEQNAS